MKFRLVLILGTILFLNNPNKLSAAVGDTTKIRVHDAVHMSWWGEYKEWGVFPPAGTSFRRINLDFTLGCPSVGCSDWDYTVQVEALRHTGQYDSTLVQAPYYTVNGASPATIYSNTTPVYITSFNSSTLSTDSVMASTFWVMIHNDPVDPFLITDSMLVYPGNYYNYVFNFTGTIIDSVLVGSNNTLNNSYIDTYNVFEIIERIELARVITPYGGYFNNSWSNTVHFDITDLAPILHDSVEIRAFYGGWSDGFAITLDFNFIEGTPPRTPLQVHNIYSSGPGGFPYGNANNSIENYLTPKTFNIGLNETNALLRIIPTGHGAGTQNCAEFCLKNYKIKLDGIQQFQQQIWRNDCGLNHLMHQAGTWIYDRANWCPGEKGTIREHDISTMITPGNPITVDMDLDAYTNTNTSQNPNYIMAAQLITFSNPNFQNDVSMEEILAPNNDFYYNRFNPICSNPIVVIKNTGANALTSATITYGIKGATPSTYQWTGNLAFNQTAQVQLGTIDWNSLTNESDKFYAYVSNPGGSLDEYAYNDTMNTYIRFTPEYAYSFVLLFQTNNAYFESSYNIKDAAGNTVFANGTLAANTLYRDTLYLAPGCYTYNVNDSGKDGLAFFANNDGNGFTRFVNAFGPGVLRYFEADFGTRFSHQFTVGYVLSEPELESRGNMSVYPNPSSGDVNIDLSFPENRTGTIEIYNAIGKLVWKTNFHNTDNPLIKSDLSGFPAGIYFIKSVTPLGEMVKKLILQPTGN